MSGLTDLEREARQRERNARVAQEILNPTSSQYASEIVRLSSKLLALEEEVVALKQLVSKARVALTFVSAFFKKLEDSCPFDDDPLRRLRKNYHAPVYAVIKTFFEAAADVAKKYGA